MQYLKRLVSLKAILAMALIVSISGVAIGTTNSSAGTNGQSAISSSCAAKTLRIGDRNTCVKQLQKMLEAKGYPLNKYGADGIFGKNTQKAVVNYQKKNNLDVDGVVGSQTWGHFRIGNSTVGTGSNSSCSTKTIRQGSKGTCVKNAQKLLLKNGEWLGSYGADGSFGSNTTRAVKHYQARYNLVADGIVGPNTWKKLSSGKVKTNHLDSSCFSGGTWACVDKSDQITYVFENGKLIRQMASRTGGSFYDTDKSVWKQRSTPNGTFKLGWRSENHVSTLYPGARMDNAQFFKSGGYAVHGSPSFTSDGNYINSQGKEQGSGGCVNLTLKDAKWLWNNTIENKDHILIQN